MRQARHNAASARPASAGLDSSAGVANASPHRAQKVPLWTGNSVQQTSQIGTRESRGKGEPQRAQNAGRRAQPKASTGLRSTRATARHREVSDGGTSNVSEPEFLRKTHLTWGLRGCLCLSACLTAGLPARLRAALPKVYPHRGGDSIPFHKETCQMLAIGGQKREHPLASDRRLDYSVG
jgi:hypothetical protein